MATIFSQRSWLLCLLAIFLSHGFNHIEASHKVFRNLESLSVQSTSVKQPYRTSYHFQPPQNWINDPNGPMVYKGLYHLFYQYNPKGAVWGNIVWAHSTSTDLINWTPHDPAIYPSEPFDQNGCWSGSATIHPKLGPIILYTGIDPKNQQVQNLAKPKNTSDPFLIEWYKPTDINPLMTPTVQNGINSSSFRDPTEAWVGPDGVWRTIIGSKNHRTGLAILYRSRDFLRWKKADRPLHSAEGTGMWECPDFFPVATRGKHGVDTSTLRGVKHVFKVSLDDTKHEYYTLGSYDPKKDVYVPDHGSIESDAGLRYDYGKFYASKTFFESIQKRRILWGWINESSSVQDDVKKGWAGVQAIPRTILLEKSGKQLVQWPVTEIKKLRHNQVKYLNKSLKAGSKFEVSRVTPSKADVDISFKVSGLEKAEVLDPSWTNPQILCSQKSASAKGSLGPFGLLTLASKGLEEYTAVFFRIFKSHHKYVVLMCSDQSRSSLSKDNDMTTYGAFVNVDPVHETISLRSLIDNSIVESFGGKGKAVITARVYPKLAIGGEAKLYAFNYGSQDVTITSLKAWSMKKAELNGDN